MTTVENPNNDEHPDEPIEDPAHAITAVDPSEFAFRTQTLALIRYLVDIKKVPAEQFRQAAQELGVADVIAEARRFTADNPGRTLVVDQQALAAVLIHTLLTTQLSGETT